MSAPHGSGSRDHDTSAGERSWTDPTPESRFTEVRPWMAVAVALWVAEAFGGVWATLAVAVLGTLWVVAPHLGAARNASTGGPDGGAPPPTAGFP